jgi:SAM-dependent methyltransferase
MDDVVFQDDDETNPLFFQWMEGDSLAPPCQSEVDVITPMLDFIAQHIPQTFISEPQNAIFYDLGCGDGRVCLAATKKFNCRSIGVEIEEFLIERFQKKLTLLQLEHMVQIVHGDLRDVSFELGSSGTVISMYLLPEALELIKEKLLDALRDGAIVVCNSWGLKGITPTAKSVGGETNNVNFFLYTKDCVEVL